jgi:hypothetical protein
MTPYYDYCDTYDAYDSGLTLDYSNKIKTFSCNVCKQSKFILKKSVGDSVFKCEECLNTDFSQQNKGNQQNKETTWNWFSFF